MQIMKFDTDYAPKSSKVELNKNNNCKEINILFVRIDENGTDPDLNISIIQDTEENRKIISELEDVQIVGTGKTTESIARLMYGINHSSRLLYKDTMSTLVEFYKKYTSVKFLQDDEILRNELNSIKEDYE